MDPFTEKEMIDSLKSIALSLRNIDRKIDDLTIAIRENGLDPNNISEEEELEEDTSEEIINDGFNPTPEDPSENEGDGDQEDVSSDNFEETKIIITQEEPEENSGDFF